MTLHTANDLADCFSQAANGLPVFNGGTADDAAAVWRKLDSRESEGHWRRAAMCATLDRLRGWRTDINGPTPRQQFAKTVDRTPEYVSRLARTYYVWNRPDDPRITRWLHDPRVSFKHYMVAANGAALPAIALQEATAHGWSANELARVLASRANTTLLDADGAPLTPVTDDDDIDADHQWPERRSGQRRPRRTHRLLFLLTLKEHRTFAHQLRQLAAVLGTTTDHGTLLSVLERAHREWVQRAAPAPSDSTEADDPMEVARAV